jgi:hypothetical protein
MQRARFLMPVNTSAAPGCRLINTSAGGAI